VQQQQGLPSCHPSSSSSRGCNRSHHSLLHLQAAVLQAARQTCLHLRRNAKQVREELRQRKVQQRSSQHLFQLSLGMHAAAAAATARGGSSSSSSMLGSRQHRSSQMATRMAVSCIEFALHSNSILLVVHAFLLFYIWLGCCPMHQAATHTCILELSCQAIALHIWLAGMHYGLPNIRPIVMLPRSLLLQQPAVGSPVGPSPAAPPLSIARGRVVHQRAGEAAWR
jgi:hypothetical protein